MNALKRTLKYALSDQDRPVALMASATCERSKIRAEPTFGKHIVALHNLVFAAHCAMLIYSG